MILQRFCSNRLSYNVFRWADTIGSSSNCALYVTKVYKKSKQFVVRGMNTPLGEITLWK